MKQKKTFKQFRMSLAQVDKEIKDTEKENELLNKHFHLMQVKRKNQLMTRGIENTHDEVNS